MATSATPATRMAVERSRRGAVNVGTVERLACLAGGGGLLLWGLIRRSPAAVAAAIVGAGLAYRGASGRSLAYRMLGIRSAREEGGRVVQLARGGGIAIERALTIGRPSDEVYRFWRNLENLPRFMRHVEDVRSGPDGRSRWVVRGPAGRRVRWEAEVTEDRPPRLIAWRSLRSADVEHAGRVEFAPAPGGRGTVVRVSLTYRAPGGKPGALLAKLLGEEPGQQVADDLRRLKQLLEAGEIPTTEGQPAARAG
jgi:uncharacterized membrane protein